MPQTPKTSVKLLALNTIDQLPDEATWDDVMYRIYVRKKIEDGLQDVEDSKTISTSEVRKQFGLPLSGFR
jgi:hypothetical protein